MVLSYKAAPQSDAALMEWLKRFMDIGLVERKGDAYVRTKNYSIDDVKKNVQFAIKHGANYILISVKSVPKYLEYGNGTELFLKNDKYAIIRLSKL